MFQVDPKCEVSPILSLILGRILPKPVTREAIVISLANDEYMPGVSVAFTNKYGKPAKVDGIPVWSTDDVTIAEPRNVSADGMTAEIWTIDGATGACQIHCKADADLGAGTVEVDLTLTVEVKDDAATGGQINAGGTPIEKP